MVALARYAAPLMEGRIDNGNAVDLKPAFCRDWRRCRPPQAEVVEYTHREAIPVKQRLI